MLLDEVHVTGPDVPQSFVVLQRPLQIRTHGHVRPRRRSHPSAPLIGPKLCEANWMDLTHVIPMDRVQCVEVWCLMSLPSTEGST